MTVHCSHSWTDGTSMFRGMGNNRVEWLFCPCYELSGDILLAIVQTDGLVDVLV